MAPGTWGEGELLGFDLETTGVDRFADVPVSFGLVRYRAGLVAGRDGSMVDPGRDIPLGATAIHGITTARARAEGRFLGEVVEHVAAVLVDASSRGVPVVGMNLSYDLTIVDAQCRRRDGRGLVERGWEGPALDALVIDRGVDRYRAGSRRLEDLCGHYCVVLEDAHDALADAEAALGVVLAIADAYPEVGCTSLDDLHCQQVLWHREWAESFDEFCRSNERDPLLACDFIWPLAVDETPAKEVA